MNVETTNILNNKELTIKLIDTNGHVMSNHVNESNTSDILITYDIDVANQNAAYVKILVCDMSNTYILRKISGIDNLYAVNNINEAQEIVDFISNNKELMLETFETEQYKIKKELGCKVINYDNLDQLGVKYEYCSEDEYSTRKGN